MRVLIDTNILLDLILDRSPFADAAEQIWEACRAGRFEGNISALSVPNIFYVVRKAQGAAKARQAVNDVLSVFEVVTLNLATLEVAQTLSLSDYEDAIQLASALVNSLDSVVTRNLSDFSGASLPVLSPTDFLDQLSAESNNAL